MSIASFMNRTKNAAQEFKLRHINFDNGNRVERDMCEEIMTRQCKSVMVKRTELVDALKKTTWKEHSVSFASSADDSTGEPAVSEVASDAVAEVTTVSSVTDTTESIATTAAAAAAEPVPVAENAVVAEAVVAGDDGEDNSSEYLSFDEISVKLAKLLNWDEKKRAKMEKRNAVKDLCFSEFCPSTHVSTSEMMALLAKNGIFGELTADNYLPDRGTKPTFLVRLKVAPARISWAQLCQLYNDDFKFCELVVKLDKMFYELQKEAFKVEAKKDKTIKKVDDDKLHVKQLQMTKVPIERLYKKILLKKFPREPAEKRHPFWSTKIGEKWAVEGAAAMSDPTKSSFSISWRKAYNGLQEIAPVVKDAIQDNQQFYSTALYDTEKSRLGGRSSMSRMESVGDLGEEEDNDETHDDDPTSASAQAYAHVARHARNASSVDSSSSSSSSAVISPDELIRLQMQVKTSTIQLALLQQQLAASNQLVDERNTQVLALQAQLDAAAAASGVAGAVGTAGDAAAAAAVYTAEHLQQAVAQAHSQSQATISSLQQQVAAAILPQAAAATAAATDVSAQTSYTAEHLQQAVAQATAQSQATISLYQKQAQAAEQQLAAHLQSLSQSAENSAAAAATSPSTTTAPPVFAGLFGGLKKQYRA